MAKAEPGPAERSEFADAPLLRGEVAFRLLVEAVADYAIFLLGPDGRVLTWNLGAQRIKGYTADEIIGQHFSVFYTPEEREARRPHTLLGWAAEYGRFEDEGWRVRKDGTRFWADVVVTALRDESGTPYAYAKVTRDLTERRAAEQQQRALIGEQRARAAAEEALQARDRFLSIASHELKTPVASLQLAVESLLRAERTGKLDGERMRTSLDRMIRSTARLGGLVNELLDVSRLTSKMSTFTKEPTDVMALVQDVVARYGESEQADRMRVTGPEHAWIPADPSRLDQVFTNLIDNALKYSSPPSVVEVELWQDEKGLRFTVADRGIGLDAEADPDDDGNAGIFEAFGRGQNAEHIPGIGLGLYISREIVRRHGGRIAARANDGSGATFSVWLPGDRQPAT